LLLGAALILAPFLGLGGSATVLAAIGLMIFMMFNMKRLV
jgi:hypothetical protein